MAAKRVRREEFALTGDRIAEAARSLFRSLLQRRVTLKTRGGRRLLPVPLLIALPITLLLPLWVLVGALASLAVGLRITLEGPARESESEPPAPVPAPD
jgi:hypothetical protein